MTEVVVRHNGNMTLANPRYQFKTDPLPAIRECKTCKEAKPLTDEFFYRHGTGGFRHECVACRGVSAAVTRDGVTREQYDSLLTAQKGVCAICGREDRGKRSGWKLSVDHNHKTLAIRGLLCAPCNLAIDYFQDNPELCRIAADYLEKEPVMYATHLRSKDHR
jgi:Recombination endonuclease VII